MQSVTRKTGFITCAQGKKTDLPLRKKQPLQTKHEPYCGQQIRPIFRKEAKQDKELGWQHPIFASTHFPAWEAYAKDQATQRYIKVSEGSSNLLYRLSN